MPRVRLPRALQPADRGGYPLPSAAHRARRSREMTPLSAAHRARRSREMMPLSAAHRARRSREMTPQPAGPPLPQARRIAANSSTAFAEDHGAVRGSPSPPFAGDHAAGPPLTQARRAAADPSPVDPVHTSRPGVPGVPRLVVPTGTF